MLGEGAFRKLGATLTNGGGFNGLSAVDTNSDIYYLDITFVYDHIEQLAKIFNDKAGYDLLKSKMDNITKKVTRGINALTFANQLVASLNAVANGNGNIVTRATGDTAVGKFLDAQALLTDGDQSIGVDMFPYENRQSFASSTYANELKQTGNVILNSNLGQQMLATGVLNPFNNEEDSKTNYRTGYFGDIDGVPLMVVSSVIWTLTEQYIAVANAQGVAQKGLYAGAISSGLQAVVCSGLGTLRGIDMSNAIEVVPSPLGQGWILEPLVSGGVSTISALSVVPIVKADFVNPATVEAPLTILAPENRQYASVTTITGITVAGNAAEAGAGNTYTANVANNVASAAVAVTGAQANTTILGTGTLDFEIGDNVFPITVFAQDGITKTVYTLTVTRAAA